MSEIFLDIFKKKILKRYLFFSFFFLFVFSSNEAPLHWAIRSKKIDVVNALMKHGADPYITCGQTPMEMAINGNMKAIVALMKCKLEKYYLYRFYLNFQHKKNKFSKIISF